MPNAETREGGFMQSRIQVFRELSCETAIITFARICKSVKRRRVFYSSCTRRLYRTTATPRLETFKVIPTTSLPIVTALFLIGIGVLIGHLLFFRYEKSPASEEQGESTGDKRSRRQIDGLRQTINEQAAEIVSLRQTRQNLETQWHELKSREEDQSTASLRAQHERAEALENLNKAIEAEKTTNEQLHDAQNRVSELEEALAKAIDELKTSTSANQQLATQSQQLESQLPNVQELNAQLQEATNEKEALKNQIESSREELKVFEKRSIESLAERETMLAQLTLERDRRNAAESKVLSVEADLAEAKFEVEQLNVLHDENESASITIANQNSRIAKLTSELDELNSAGRDQRQTIDQLKSQLRQQDQLASQVEQFSATILAITAENEMLRAASSSQSTEIENTDSRYAKILREHQAVKESLDQSQANANLLQNENESLNRDLVSQKEEIEKLSQKLAQQNEQLKSLETLRPALQEKDRAAENLAREVKSKDARLTELQNDRDKAYDDLRSSKLQFREEKSKAHQQIKHLVQQREESMKRMAEVEANLRNVESERLADREEFQILENQLDERNSVDTTLEQLQDQLATETEKRMMIEVEIEDRNNEIAHLRSRLEGYELLQTQNEELRKTQKSQQQRFDLAKKERDEALAAERTTKQIVSELRDELEQRLNAVEALEQDKEEAVARLAAEKRARAALSEQLNSDQEELAKQQRSLKRKLADREKKVEQLRAEIDEMRTQKDGEAVQHFISLASFRTANSGVEGFPEMEKMTFDDSLGPLYRRAPKDRDDLKLIHGIASIMERKLNKLGVYSFQQIMEWDDVAVAEFSKLLAFGDRVQRDNWIGQARRLFREKIDQQAA